MLFNYGFSGVNDTSHFNHATKTICLNMWEHHIMSVRYHELMHAFHFHLDLHNFMNHYWMDQHAYFSMKKQDPRSRYRWWINCRTEQIAVWGSREICRIRGKEWDPSDADRGALRKVTKTTRNFTKSLLNEIFSTPEYRNELYHLETYEFFPYSIVSSSELSNAKQKIYRTD
jgi:hypothetical protein